MKQIYFYATKEDLFPVLKMVEQGKSLKYVRMGNFTKPELDIYMHGSEIPNFGKANSKAGSTCEAFLVCDHATNVNMRAFKGNGAIDRFCVDQLLNPDTVTFTPAGAWNEDILLDGRVATVSQSPTSQELMKLFQKAIKKHFTKIRAFYVGSEAHSMLKAGKRLAIGADSPREFDLAPLP
jgi:hypothetical protein